MVAGDVCSGLGVVGGAAVVAVVVKSGFAVLTVDVVVNSGFSVVKVVEVVSAAAVVT